jgi:hypothetical protein
MTLTAGSRVLRSVAVAASAVLTLGFVIAGASAPAGAAPVKGDLIVLSVTDTGSGLGAPVQDRPFDVVVEVVDADGQPLAVNQATTIVLEEVSGPGELDGNTEAIIPRNGSGTTISGATYSQYANGVQFLVRAVSGVDLAPDEITVDVALTAVGRTASPNVPLELTDEQGCAVPTAEVPTCGYLLLSNGARGHVTLSVGSCEGLGPAGRTPCRTVGDTTGLVVQALADVQGLYDAAPATLVVACDKVLCGQSGVPHLPLLYDLDNTGLIPAPLCPAKGVLGEDQDVCYDEVQSTRHDGDLYSYLLFRRDLRASQP